MTYSCGSFNSTISCGGEINGMDNPMGQNHVPDYFARRRQHEAYSNQPSSVSPERAHKYQYQHHPMHRHYAPVPMYDRGGGYDPPHRYDRDQMDVYSEPPARRRPSEAYGEESYYEGERMRRSKPHMLDKKVFIGGLDYGMGDAELVDFFENRFGPVEAATVVKNRFNMSRGFGFVIFKYVEHAERAIREAPFLCNGTKVDIRKAIPKAKMPERESRYAYPSEGSLRQGYPPYPQPVSRYAVSVPEFANMVPNAPIDPKFNNPNMVMRDRNMHRGGIRKDMGVETPNVGHMNCSNGSSQNSRRNIRETRNNINPMESDINMSRNMTPAESDICLNPGLELPKGVEVYTFDEDYEVKGS